MEIARQSTILAKNKHALFDYRAKNPNLHVRVPSFHNTDYYVKIFAKFALFFYKTHGTVELAPLITLVCLYSPSHRYERNYRGNKYFSEAIPLCKPA